METVLYIRDTRGRLRKYKLSVSLYNPKTKDIIPYTSSFRDLYPNYVPVKLTEYGIIDMKQTRNVSKITIPKTKRGAGELDTFLAERFARFVADLQTAGYRETKELAINDVNLRPMLLTKYSRRQVKRFTDYWIQPKIDGVRCLAKFNPLTNRFQFFSRRNKEFYGLDHLNADLMRMRSRGANVLQDENIIIDGELYITGFDLQKIHGVVSKRVNLSKQDVGLKSKIKYIVFDMIFLRERDLGFIDRWRRLESFFRGRYTPKAVTLIDIYEPVKSEGELNKLHHTLVKADYEGVVLRRASAPYRFGKRAGADVMKKKFNKEADYKVINFTAEGKGKFLGAIIWICEAKTKTGAYKQFHVVPDGTKAERIDAYATVRRAPDQYIGRLLQVRYYDKTADNIPKFANSALYPKIAKV